MGESQPVMQLGPLHLGCDLGYHRTVMRLGLLHLHVGYIPGVLQNCYVGEAPPLDHVCF